MTQQHSFERKIAPVPVVPRVVVIGAGVAGLCAASELVQAGSRVVMLEKSRGVGGRMSTRRIGSAVFDHGAQYFTIRGRAFGNIAGDALRAGAVEKWCEGFPRAAAAAGGPASLAVADVGDEEAAIARWRGTRGMTDLPKRIAETLAGAAGEPGGFELRTGAKVVAIGADGAGVRIVLEEGDPIGVDAAVVTAPAPQSLDLFRAAGGVLAEAAASTVDGDAVRRLEAIRYDPCFALMLVLDRPSLVPPPGGVRFDDGPVSWIADNHAKGISPVPSLTVHASGAFSSAHFDDPPEVVMDLLVEAVRPWLGGEEATTILERSLHRWKFSLVSQADPAPMLAVSTTPPIVCCGDGFGGGRVEAGASSGLAAGRWLARLLASSGPRSR